MTVRGVGGSHEAVKQTGSGFWGRRSGRPRGARLEFWLTLPTRSLPHDLVMGWGLPCWLPACSHHFEEMTLLTHCKC